MSVRVQRSRSANILHPLQTLQCIFLSLSRSDFRSVEPTQRETDRVRPCPMESIRQHFTPSVNTSMYFSKSLAIGLPLSRTDTKRDGSCPSVDGVDPPTFSVNTSMYFSVSRDRTSAQWRETGRVRPCPFVPMESIRQHFTPSVNTSMYFSKSLAIGLPLSRTDKKRDGSCPVRVRSCPMESIRQHFTPSVNTSMYFSKSLAIGLPLSRTDKKRESWTVSVVSDGVNPPTYTLCKHLSD